MSIRSTNTTSNTVFNEVTAIRGDTTKVLIRKSIPEGSTIRAHLRKEADSEEYHILDIEEQYVVITPQVSEFLKGTYIFDVEVTLDSEVTTLQQTQVLFLADVTRTYGTEPDVDISDFERKKIIAESFWIRGIDNSLEEIPLTGLTQLLIDTTEQAGIASDKALEASGYATSAEGYRDESSGFKSDAEAYSLSAEQSKEDAQTAAQTATSKVEEILGSATLVEGYTAETLGYRNEAEQFKIDANISYVNAEGVKEEVDQIKLDTLGYKNAAEGARDESISAKNDSVTAQGLSEDARDASVIAQGLAEGAAEQTALDVIATAGDREQTGLDRIATGDDAEQTALDVIQTGEDRVQTGLDVISASASASAAANSIASLETPITWLDNTTLLATGNDQFTFTVPASLNGKSMAVPNFSVTTPSTSGVPTFQIRNLTTGQTMLSTAATIDINDYSSYTADIPAVVNPTYKVVSTGDRLAIDCSISGTGTKGCTIILKFVP